MGDIGIIARRLDIDKVEYGWCGNGACFIPTGARILQWYDTREKVDWLFSRGQMRYIPEYNTHPDNCYINQLFWVHTSERYIFSKIAFIDNGYFYDLDDKWYYIIPGPFRIKVPLELVKNTSERWSFYLWLPIHQELIDYILNVYPRQDKEFATLLKEYNVKEMRKELWQCENSVYEFYHCYNKLFSYFDNWVVVETNPTNNDFIGFIVKKAMKKEDRKETYSWNLPIITISELSYQLYKFDWLNKHIDMETEKKIEQDYLTYRKNYKEDEEEYPLKYELWLEEFGYNGKLYSSYEDFYSIEFQNRDYVHKLFKKNAFLCKQYDAFLDKLELLKERGEEPSPFLEVEFCTKMEQEFHQQKTME